MSLSAKINSFSTWQSPADVAEVERPTYSIEEFDARTTNKPSDNLFTC